jgi:glycosyltransferase involved in cell wall biosynthesis
VPAYNEAAVIARCLHQLTHGAGVGELEIIVVCNGCVDNTAELARAFGPPVRVIETDQPSKTNALNLGDAEAVSFPRFYLDADVEIDIESVRAVAAALEQEGVLAAAPQPVNTFDKATRWGVRAFYRFWTALPYIQEGMIAAGAYAMNKAGRARFEKFPDIIADDGYVRMLFDAGERILVGSATSRVHAPLSLRNLMKIKTRSRLGVLQLRRLYPELAQREAKSKHYVQAFFHMARRPALYLSAIPYFYVAVVSWFRAQRQIGQSDRYVWERDESSRHPQVRSN